MAFRAPHSLFQSTLPRRERLSAILQFHQAYRISIHAPAKGATPAGAKNQFNDFISIHAPAKGATGTVGGVGMTENISIHAPAKGATHCQNKLAGNIDDFNPRSREGSDHIRLIMVIRILVFQSTLPRRERRDYLTNKVFRLVISIHAPAKGATQFQTQLPDN
mgnify:CR=1 FL=1